MLQPAPFTFLLSLSLSHEMSSPRRAPAGGRGATGGAGAPAPAPDAAAAAASPGGAGAGAEGGSPDAASENADADDLDRGEEESEGEDLLDEDNYAADYEARPELDQYEAEGIDENEDGYDEIDPRERARAEARMAKRDREDMRKSGRQGTALDSPLDDEPVRPNTRHSARTPFVPRALIVCQPARPFSHTLLCSFDFTRCVGCHRSSSPSNSRRHGWSGCGRESSDSRERR